MTKLLTHLTFGILLIGAVACATKKNLSVNNSIPISCSLDGQNIQLDSLMNIKGLNSEIEISKLRFYLGKSTEDKKNIQYYLIDFSDNSTLTIPTQNNLLRPYYYYLGVDSMTNSSGAQGGALDPMNDMYWSWQSGYINLKLEGNIDNMPFTYHLGGFLDGNSAFRSIGLMSSNQTITLELDDFFKRIKESNEHDIMSPSKEACELSSILAESFKIQAR